jgi:hypothetical protein
MFELAVAAMTAKTEERLRHRIVGDVQKLDLLNRLQKRSGNAPISALAYQLLEIVHVQTNPFFRKRRTVFTVITKYSKNWWKASNAVKQFQVLDSEDDE